MDQHHSVSHILEPKLRSPPELPDLLPDVPIVLRFALLIGGVLAVNLTIGLYRTAFQTRRGGHESARGGYREIQSEEIIDMSEDSDSIHINTIRASASPTEKLAKDEIHDEYVPGFRKPTGSLGSGSAQIQNTNIEMPSSVRVVRNSRAILSLQGLSKISKSLHRSSKCFSHWISAIVDRVAVNIVILTRDNAEERDLMIPIKEGDEDEDTD